MIWCRPRSEHSVIEGLPRAAGRRFAIVVSRFNDMVTNELLAGALECLEQHGVEEPGAHVYAVPGAWELPTAAQLVARTGRYSAIVALGCVIRGDTPHFEYVAGGAAQGLMRVSLDEGIPIAFGVLTTENLEQAMERAGGKGSNKGRDAALTALELADLAARAGI
jgi:6,7-dimethyl-8-ribityllumazine synthase